MQPDTLLLAHAVASFFKAVAELSLLQKAVIAAALTAIMLLLRWSRPKRRVIFNY
jgi:hypothetical protein